MALTGAGIYLGYIGHRNLGDEAMYSVCQKQFKNIRWMDYSQAAYEASPGRFLEKSVRTRGYIFRWLGEELRYQRHIRVLVNRAVHAVASRRGGTVGILGGGTLINTNEGYLKAYRSLRADTGKPVPIFGCGVKGPEFWSSQHDWVDLRKDWVSALNELPLVGVRGPISKALLEEAGARNVIVCGDPAVQFHIPIREDDQKDGPAEQRRHIGINCGNSLGRMWGDQSTTENILTGVVRALIQSGHEISLLSVCPEDLESSYRVARMAGLAEDAVKPPLVSAGAFMEMAKRLDLLIALKLHAAVFAAAANLPFISLEYQPKCLDFTSSINWQKFTIRTDSLSISAIQDMVSTMLGNLPILRKELCMTMCRLSEDFAKYCRAIEPLLV